VSVDERRSFAAAAMLDRFGHSAVTFHGISAVDFREEEVREVCDQLGDVAAGGVDLDGNGDGVLVVLADKEHGSFKLAAEFIASQNSP